MISKNPIQVAGVIDKDEADMLIKCGVDYLGFPLRLPVHTPDLTESAAAEIISSIKPPSFGVIIAYLDQASEIIKFCQDLGASVIQLHGDLKISELEKIKNIVPELCIIKSLVIGKSKTDNLSLFIKDSSPFVDAFITDTFDPSTGASGATGKIHDWSISRRFVEESPRPVILAGGLNADNVREAILEVKPAGVDSHTGLEDSSGRKNIDMVTKFVAEAKEGFRIVENIY